MSTVTNKGWTPLQFYAYIVRTIGIPARFELRDDEWVADAPFTKPSAATLTRLEEALPEEGSGGAVSREGET